MKGLIYQFERGVCTWLGMHSNRQKKMQFMLLVAKQYRSHVLYLLLHTEKQCCASSHGNKYWTSILFQFVILILGANWLHKIFASSYKLMYRR